MVTGGLSNFEGHLEETLPTTGRRPGASGGAPREFEGSRIVRRRFGRRFGLLQALRRNGSVEARHGVFWVVGIGILLFF